MAPPIPPETESMILDTRNLEHRKIFFLWLRLGVPMEARWNEGAHWETLTDTQRESWLEYTEWGRTTDRQWRMKPKKN